MLYFGKTVLADQGNPGILLPDSSHIGSLSEKTREESVADEGVLVSLMSAFGHGVSKKSNIHVVSVFVFALIREPHDTVQESVRALIITVEYAFQRSAAAVTLHKDLRTFGQSRKVVRADGVEYVVPVHDITCVDKSFLGNSSGASKVNPAKGKSITESDSALLLSAASASVHSFAKR